MTYSIPYDSTDFITASIKEVVKTFVEALILVILIIFLFLQTWRATIIPFNSCSWYQLLGHLLECML